MFQPGNKFGRGRPKQSLSKPELLLPLIFQKRNINWASDFCSLYKKFKAGKLSNEEQKKWPTYMTLLPYLCTKVQLKEITDQGAATSAQSAANAAQTSRLLQALEDESASKG